MIATPQRRPDIPRALSLVEAYPQQHRILQGSPNAVAFETSDIHAQLLNLDQPCHIVRHQGRIGIIQRANPLAGNDVQPMTWLMTAPRLSIQQLGDPGFLKCHGVGYAYAAGAMAGGIASEDLVIALGKANLLGSFGSGFFE